MARNEDILPLVRTVHAILFDAWQRARYYQRRAASVTVRRVAVEAGIMEELAYEAMQRVLAEELTITYSLRPYRIRGRVWRVLRWDEEQDGDTWVPRRVWYQPWDEDVEGMLAKAAQEGGTDGIGTGTEPAGT